MPRFMIERHIPGAGDLSPEDLRAIAVRSCNVLRDMPAVQWVQSYVTGERITCVYIAPDEASVREHARRGGFPADQILAVRTIIDPTTSEPAGAEPVTAGPGAAASSRGQARTMDAAPMGRIALFVLVAAAAALAACSEAPASLEPTHDVAPHAQLNRALAPTPDVNRQLAELRRLTAPLHNFEKAKDAGWKEPITPCWEHTTQGGMGFHYANPGYLFDDGVVDLLQPEALMFEPGPGGQMTLVGMEYIVFLDDWTSADPPELLGQQFHEHPDLPIWKLHLWLWKDNPRGMFADWNPRVSCRHASDVEYF